MRCPNCGQQNPEEARFCFLCGTAFEATPAREERKVVTVLFADLVGFTSRAERMDPEDVRALLAPYHQRLRSELERFSGTVEKFIGDAVVALFGAPVAHEDDPERAVRAALAIRDWVREQEAELQLRIAVNTGEALIALGARPEAGEGMASGDVVNTTARLQSAAPVNGILVGEATWRATRDRIDYAEHEPVSAKGKAAPIVVWEAVHAKSRLGMDLEQRVVTPLVGRERELAVLFDAFDRVVRQREPQLVTLVGVPGIGKSRLVAELFQRIEQMPDIIRWRQGRALPYGGGVSFWALGEMVKAQAGINENDTSETAAEKLSASVDEVVDEHELAWVQRHLEALLSLAEEGMVDRQESFAAWRRYLEGLADQRPLVLVFEDLHWADDGMLDFVDHLAEWASGVPLLVLASARPELLDRRPGWGGGKLNAVTLALAPLDDTEAARVIAAVLDRAVLPAETQATLLERAGGNPLYAEQFAQLFLEQGAADGVSVPENVQATIAARLDALPENEKRLLQDAAVLGKVFWSGGLGKDVEPELHALERKAFIRRERRSAVAGEAEYAFRHVLVREVAYGQIPRPARADKHVAAAQWVESLGRPDDHAELLAHHYATALELARAVGNDTPTLAERARLALRHAGDRAAALSSYAVAADFYRSALELWPEEAPDRPPLLFALGRAEYVNGDASAARLHDSVDALLAGGFRELAGEAEAVGAEAAWYRGDRDEVERRLEHALELVESLPLSRAKAWITSQASRYAMLASDYDDAIEYATRAIEMTEALDLPDVRVHALNNLGAALGFRDGSGFEELEASVALAEQINSPELARSLNNLGSLHYFAGHVVECRAFEQRAIEAGERFGLEGLVAFSRANVLGSYLRLGMLDDSLEGAEELLAEEPAAGVAASARLYRAWVRVARDDLAGALDDSAFVLEVARRAEEPQSVFPSLNTRAYVLDAAGEREEAHRLMIELLDAVHEVKGGGLPFGAPGDMVDAQLRILGRKRALELLTGWRYDTPWLVAGRALVEEQFDRAAELYASTGSVPDVALVHLRAAQKLATAGRRADADGHLREALSFYRSARAKRFVREAEKLLAASA
jgi:class 3 adenylate cyclase/tetratricopeptide (TPR) repeat protein